MFASLVAPSPSGYRLRGLGVSTVGGYLDGGGNVRDWAGPGEEVTLTEATASDPQVGELTRGFDAFADRVEMQSLSESDDRAQEGGIGRVVLERMQELLVDLDQVHRELAQVAQRGVAGSKIVDGDPNTCLLYTSDAADE